MASLKKNAASARYAQALFEISLEKNELEAHYHDLKFINEAVVISPELNRLLQNPQLSADIRQKIFSDLFKNKVSEFILKFLLFVGEKKRLGQFTAIFEAYEERYLNHLGIARVHIISARELSKDHIEAISRKLEKRLQRQVESSVELDPSLIGGFKLKLGDQVYDYSIRSNLDKFKNRVSRF